MLEIREMRPEDYGAKGYVHWKSWQETYTGLIKERFILNQSLEKFQSIAHRWPQNTLVAEVDGKIVGYSCYGKGEDGSGEVIAIYLLKEVQGTGLGRKLMDAAIAQLADCSPITLWVLKGNDQAINFYKHYGFRLTGEEKAIPLGIELRMAYNPI